MNLPLHLGWLGALEAGLIALVIGCIVYRVFHGLGARLDWPPGHALGWSCLLAVAVGAGIDLWHLFYLGVMRLESPVYARIALQKIHDPDGLGARVLLEVVGALAGVVLGWLLAHRGQAGAGSEE